MTVTDQAVLDRRGRAAADPDVPVPVDAIGAATPPARGAHRHSIRRHRNHLLRNSMYLVLSSGLQAGLGLAFWVLATRLFSAPEVGRATSLISAATLIGFVALLGLNSTLIRYLPTSSHRDTMITTGLLLVAGCGALLALGYAVVIPFVAPRLAFVEHRPVFLVGFIVLSAAAAVNLVTDAVFIASRRAGINAFVDGGIGGVAKVLLVVVFAGTGAYGLFCASAGGFAASAVASIVLMWTQLHWRPRLKGAAAAMRPLLRTSGAYYLGNVFNLVPVLVVPLIVLDRLGPSEAAYYFVAFQVANLLYAGAYAVEQNFLAEGAHGEEPLPGLMRRAGKVLALLSLPAAAVVAVSAHRLLDLFGGGYASHGALTLTLMAVAAIPVAAENWLVTVLRLTGQLRAITVTNGIYALSICGLAWLLAPLGLGAIGVAWLLGSSIGVVATSVPVGLGMRRGALAA
jgi:O-antigen/teichoic acid export membrane protein